jgi:hypothetical protein
VAGDGVGVAASTTIAAPGAESGSAAIVHPSTTITRDHPTTQAIPDTAETGTIAHPIIVHPTPSTRRPTALPRIIRATQAIAHPPINPAIVLRQRLCRSSQANPAIGRQPANPEPVPRPASQAHDHQAVANREHDLQAVANQAALAHPRTSQAFSRPAPLPPLGPRRKTVLKPNQRRRTGQLLSLVLQIPAVNRARANQPHNPGRRLTMVQDSANHALPNRNRNAPS